MRKLTYVLLFGLIATLVIACTSADEDAVAEPAAQEVVEQQDAVGESVGESVADNIFGEAIANDFEPISASGQGDGTIAGLPGGAFVVRASHDGEGRFLVEPFMANGEYANASPIMEDGAYSGYHLMYNYDLSEGIAGLSVKTDGLWEIDVLPVSHIPDLEPGIEYTGNRVLFWDSGAATVSLLHDGDGAFMVIAYTREREHFIASTLGRFSEIVNMPEGLSIFVVTADGTWSISDAE